MTNAWSARLTATLADWTTAPTRSNAILAPIIGCLTSNTNFASPTAPLTSSTTGSLINAQHVPLVPGSIPLIKSARNVQVIHAFLAHIINRVEPFNAQIAMPVSSLTHLESNATFSAALLNIGVGIRTHVFHALQINTLTQLPSNACNAQ
jgi:hypothetical protein